MGIMDTRNLGISVSDIGLGTNLNWMERAIRNSLFGADRNIYGVSWGGGSSPVLARTDDAVGLVANVGVDDQVVVNDFDNISIWRKMVRVTDAYGNVFVRIPRFYIKKGGTAPAVTWQVSEYPHDGFYLPWCFWDFANTRELPYILVGKYKANLSGDGLRLESKPGYAPLHTKNIVQFRSLAKANGAGYQQLDIHAVDVIQTLMTIEFANLNIQAVMSGFSTGQYATTHTATVAETATNRIILANANADLYRVGQTVSIGSARGNNSVFYGRLITGIAAYDASNKAVSFGGAPVDIAIGDDLYNSGAISGSTDGVSASSGSMVSNSDGKYPCKWRGIEDPYAGMWQFVDGVNINERQAWVCANAENYASNVFAAPYEQLSYTNISTDGYPTVMGLDPVRPFAQFPITLGGGAGTFYADYYYQTSGQRIALLGGFWDFGASAGLRFWYLNSSASTAVVSFGGRLLLKPL